MRGAVIELYAFLWLTAFAQRSSHAFLFGLDGSEGECYKLDVQRCLENAFRTMRLSSRSSGAAPSSRTADGGRERGGSSAGGGPGRNDRDLPKASLSRTKHLCAANRPYLSCFNIPGCRDEFVAQVASIVFHGIHGRVHPVQMFLAHRGYALQLCSQSCSLESREQCHRMLSAQELSEERSIYSELVSISQQLSAGTKSLDKDWMICERFKASLISMLRYRVRHCGESAKCSCMDPKIHSAVVYCNAGCEHLLEEFAPFDEHSTNSSSPASRARLVDPHLLLSSLFVLFTHYTLLRFFLTVFEMPIYV